MLSIFLIGIALAMDAFSLALGIGTTNITSAHKKILSLVVASMHFIMPLIGLFLGHHIFKIVAINIDIFNTLVFLYLGIMMIIKRSESAKIIEFSLVGDFVFAFSVSVDSFSVGIGLRALTLYYFLAPLIFAVCSGILTYFGLLLGEYSIKVFKEKAPFIGAGILFTIAIVNIVVHFL